MMENLNETLQQQFGKAKESLSATVDKISDLKDSGIEKISEPINELSNGLPLIEEAGFKVEEISIDLGIPPEISIGFSKMNEVKSESIQSLIDQHAERKILVIVLKALLTANNIQSKITFNKFIFAGVSIKLGLPPSVSLKYK